MSTAASGGYPRWKRQMPVEQHGRRQRGALRVGPEGVRAFGAVGVCPSTSPCAAACMTMLTSEANTGRPAAATTLARTTSVNAATAMIPRSVAAVPRGERAVAAVTASSSVTANATTTSAP